MRFPAKITSSCIWVAIPVDWVILHWYACGADGRSVGVRSRDYQIFRNESIYLAMGLRLRVELRYYMAESASGQDGRDFPRWSRDQDGCILASSFFCVFIDHDFFSAKKKQKRTWPIS